MVAGVPLKDYSGSSAKTSEFSVRSGEQTWRLAGQHACAEFGFDDWTKARPGGCDVSSDENDFRRKRGGDEAKALAEMKGLAVERFEGCGIAVFSEAEQLL